jgi:hypothetical protein
METRILRLEDEFWRIRTDPGELADAERNLRGCFKDSVLSQPSAFWLQFAAGRSYEAY